MTFRLQDKHHLVIVANRLAIGGLAFLALAMTGAIGLVADVVFSTTVAVAGAGLVGLSFVALWLVWPLWRRAARGRDGARAG